MHSGKSTQPQRRVNLPRLRRQLENSGVLQKDVAAAAGVTKFMVCHVLAGRAKSARVVAIAQRLIAEARAARSADAERKAS